MMMMGDEEGRDEPCCCASSSKESMEKDEAIDVRDADQEEKGRFSRFCDVFAKIALIVGGFIIVLGALRNTLTYYLQMFWGVSGNFWMRQWDKVYDIFEGDTLNISIAMLVALIVQYWLVCAFFLVVDILRPAFILKYKIQPLQNDPVPKGKLHKAVLTVIANQTVVSFPIAVLVYNLMKWRGCGFSAAELPSFQWVMLELFVFLIVEECGFYYSHRLAHHPRLYKYVHKKHHEWTAPISIIAIYAHPIEHIFSNLMPVVLGPMIMGSHIATLTMWAMLAQSSAINSHCGYHLPLLPSPEAHDFHHLKFTNNFGTLGILDRLHGTDELFRKTKPYLRHFLLLGLTPVSQTYPDDPKRKEFPCAKDE